MPPIFPPKLQLGDEIRIVAPALSLRTIKPANRQIAENFLTQAGFKISYSRHAQECDDFNSSRISSRMEDLHQAFLDPEVKMILAADGGFNSNQLFNYLDWQLIKTHPKIFCGYSDMTALQNAIWQKGNLVTYHGPMFWSFSYEESHQETWQYFLTCLTSDSPFELKASFWRTDDNSMAQEKPNGGFWPINPGEATGTLIGGNLCTLNLLQGSSFMPDFNQTILFIEDDYESQIEHFDRDLQSLIHLPNFGEVKGLLIGRFERASHVDFDLLAQIVASKPELANLPIIANVDFGHTNPKFTLPIGGTAQLKVSGQTATINILEH